MSRNERKLSIIYHKKQKDFVVYYPRTCDGALAMKHLVGDILRYRIPKDGNDKTNFEAQSFIKELEKRGYDITTLKFSIELKKDTEQ